jgi:hypothetical protein
MTESFLRGAFQTRKAAVDSAQRALDDLLEQATVDGLDDVVRELAGDAPSSAAPAGTAGG